jgi:hypothetical protein
LTSDATIIVKFCLENDASCQGAMDWIPGQKLDDQPTCQREGTKKSSSAIHSEHLTRMNTLLLHIKIESLSSIAEIVGIDAFGTKACLSLGVKQASKMKKSTKPSDFFASTSLPSSIKIMAHFHPSFIISSIKAIPGLELYFPANAAISTQQPNSNIQIVGGAKSILSTFISFLMYSTYFKLFEESIHPNISKETIFQHFKSSSWGRFLAHGMEEASVELGKCVKALNLNTKDSSNSSAGMSASNTISAGPSSKTGNINEEEKEKVLHFCGLRGHERTRSGNCIFHLDEKTKSFEHELYKILEGNLRESYFAFFFYFR